MIGMRPSGAMHEIQRQYWYVSCGVFDLKEA